MAYSDADARGQLLDTISEAVEHLGRALAALGAAYDQLDERTADRLEDELFRPMQAAYGRAQRVSTAFADRHGLTARTFAVAPARSASPGVARLLEDAVEAASAADQTLARLQDSMLPVDVGDPELRAGLAEVRTLLRDVRSRARALVRVLGR